MSRVMRALTALGLVAVFGCADVLGPSGEDDGGIGWSVFHDPQGKYSIELPAPAPTPPRRTFSVTLNPRATFTVGVGPTNAIAQALPEAWQAFVADPSNRSAADQLLAEHLRQIVYSLQNPTNPNRPVENHAITSAIPIDQAGVPGVDVVMRLDNGHTYTRRLYLTREGVFEVQANIAAGAADPAIGKRMFDSFTINPAPVTASLPPVNRSL